MRTLIIVVIFIVVVSDTNWQGINLIFRWWAVVILPTVLTVLKRVNILAGLYVPTRLSVQPVFEVFISRSNEHHDVLHLLTSGCFMVIARTDSGKWCEVHKSCVVQDELPLLDCVEKITYRYLRVVSELVVRWRRCNKWAWNLGRIFDDFHAMTSCFLASTFHLCGPILFVSDGLRTVSSLEWVFWRWVKDTAFCAKTSGELCWIWNRHQQIVR